MTKKDQIYLLALSNIKGLSNRVLNNLLQEYKNPNDLYFNFPLVKIKFPELNEVLFSLELNDSIKQYPGKIYTL